MDHNLTRTRPRKNWQELGFRKIWKTLLGSSFFQSFALIGVLITDSNNQMNFAKRDEQISIIQN